MSKPVKIKIKLPSGKKQTFNTTNPLITMSRKGITLHEDFREVISKKQENSEFSRFEEVDRVGNLEKIIKNMNLLSKDTKEGYKITGNVKKVVEEIKENLKFDLMLTYFDDESDAVMYDDMLTFPGRFYMLYAVWDKRFLKIPENRDITEFEKEILLHVFNETKGNSRKRIQLYVINCFDINGKLYSMKSLWTTNEDKVKVNAAIHNELKKQDINISRTMIDRIDSFNDYMFALNNYRKSTFKKS